MLAKVTAVFPSNWVLTALTFVYNETPHRSTGLSCHEIIIGSDIDEPLSLLKDMWVKLEVTQYQTYNTYLKELRERIVKGCQLEKFIMDTVIVAENCEL